jgi:hypothetical protein
MQDGLAVKADDIDRRGMDPEEVSDRFGVPRCQRAFSLSEDAGAGVAGVVGRLSAGSGR